MDIEISGLDDVQRDLSELQQAMAGLDGALGTVSIDPDDPQSLERAIQQVEEIVNTRLAPYHNNPMVEHFSEQIKAHLREQIIEQAKEAATEHSS